MSNLKTFFVIFFFFFSIINVFSKEIKNIPEIDSINQYVVKIESALFDNEKEYINNNLINYFLDFLENPKSFDINYDSLKYISVLKSSDDLLRVFTWNLYFEDGSFKYFGFLQYKSKDKVKVFFLNDKKYNFDEKDESIRRLYNSNSEWYGAIYYGIITKKFNSTTYYTLIGWDGVDFLINRKVIEVLKFTRHDFPVFGGKNFKLGKVYADKLIFEYADRATMLLRYNEKRDIIVMDHLSPSEEKYRGLFEYYGPDFSYDALVFKRGYWELDSDIDPNIAINFEKNNKINQIKRRKFSMDF